MPAPVPWLRRITPSFALPARRGDGLSSELWLTRGAVAGLASSSAALVAIGRNSSKCWAWRGEEEMACEWTAHDCAVTACASCGGGSALVTGAVDGSVTLWHPVTHARRCVPRGATAHGLLCCCASNRAAGQLAAHTCVARRTRRGRGGGSERGKRGRDVGVRVHKWRNHRGGHTFRRGAGPHTTGSGARAPLRRGTLPHATRRVPQPRAQPRPFAFACRGGAGWRLPGMRAAAWTCTRGACTAKLLM